MAIQNRKKTVFCISCQQYQFLRTPLGFGIVPAPFRQRFITNTENYGIQARQYKNTNTWSCTVHLGKSNAVIFLIENSMKITQNRYSKSPVTSLVLI